MEKYLYLNELGYADTWVNGGMIPINLASKHKSDTRKGTKTPDENLIYKSEFPLSDLEHYGMRMHENAQIMDFTFSGNVFNGVLAPETHNAQHYNEDGLSLSFCNHFSEKTAERFIGKRACVKILNIRKTKQKIDKRLGRKGIMKNCEYTEDHQRNHFLKSKKDEWQDEFRMFWKSTDEKWVEIPTGTAELVWKLD